METFSQKADRGDDTSQMDMAPYFTAINHTVPKDMMMVMMLSDFQRALRQ
ncbi:MAG: hypothetical protein QOE33_3424 [Acidobacteriota bacterium]|nr:hypothetical protein [Acidobacteriota bacterium]